MAEEIITSRTRMEPLGPQHDDLIIGLYTDPLVTALMGKPPFDEQAALFIIDFLMGPWSKDGFGHFVAVERARGVKMGLVGIRPCSSPSLGEIGVMLMPEFWNRGLATELLQATVKWGFEELQLQQIVAKDVVSAASLSALQKCGFEISLVAEDQAGQGVYCLALDRDWAR